MISAVRDTKIPRTKPCIVLKRSLKHFVEQAFFLDLSHFNWDCNLLIDYLNLAWKYFHDNFSYFIDKHAPLRRFRVKG